MQFNSLPPTSYILSPCHSVSLLTLPYAFSRSTKPTYTTFFLPCLLTYLLSEDLNLNPPCLSLNLQSLYGLCLLGSLHIFLQPHLTSLYQYNCCILSSLLVQWNHHSGSPFFRHNTTLKSHITQTPKSSPPPCYLHLLSSLL